MYHDLGMGWFQSCFAAADAGTSRAVMSVNAMMNFVNLQNLCLAIPKFPDAGWPSGLNYQIWFCQVLPIITAGWRMRL